MAIGGMASRDESHSWRSQPRTATAEASPAIRNRNHPGVRASTKTQITPASDPHRRLGHVAGDWPHDSSIERQRFALPADSLCPTCVPFSWSENSAHTGR